ncbi:MAG TPA: hypothetical protein VFZ79_10965 [Acidimicrobiales bacterium]
MSPTPFERARTALCYGERLRRAKRLVDARAPLQSALKLFTELGAEPWAARARAELAAAGDRRPGRHPSFLHRLSGQELEIADLVAEGATNKEIATSLLLRSRAELTRAVLTNE